MAKNPKKEKKEKDSEALCRPVSAAELVLVVGLCKTVDPKNWEDLLYRLSKERVKRKKQKEEHK